MNSNIDIKQLNKFYHRPIKDNNHIRSSYNYKTEITLSADIFFHENNVQIPIFIAVDYYTRMVFLKVLEKKSENVLGFLDEIFEKLDPYNNREIKTIITDQGTEFNQFKKYKKATHKYSTSIYKASISESHINRIRRLYSYLLAENELKSLIAKKKNTYNKQTKRNIIALYENIVEILNAREIKNRGYSANVLFESLDDYNEVIQHNKEYPEDLVKVPEMLVPYDYGEDNQEKDKTEFYVFEIVLLADKEKRNKALVGKVFTKNSSMFNYQLWPGVISKKSEINGQYIYEVSSPYDNTVYKNKFYASELISIPVAYAREYVRVFRSKL